MRTYYVTIKTPVGDFGYYNDKAPNSAELMWDTKLLHKGFGGQYGARAMISIHDGEPGTPEYTRTWCRLYTRI
ncbi:MAG: hypothetical protein V4438_01925 [Patescibacteria group bacterium]